MYHQFSVDIPVICGKCKNKIKPPDVRLAENKIICPKCSTEIHLEAFSAAIRMKILEALTNSSKILLTEQEEGKEKFTSVKVQVSLNPELFKVEKVDEKFIARAAVQQQNRIIEKKRNLIIPGRN